MSGMKPINAEEKGCSPISSNCVIWQGPDIECIKLCKGDTVSDVVYKLATELCKLLDMFDIDAYELSCLNLGNCGPADFQALIQLLIERICALEGIEPGDTPSDSNGCPDCIVNIASCFYFQNPQGDTVTTMQLVDYVTAIGNMICTMTAQIITINLTLQNHENRISTLENEEDPELVLPLVTPVCVTDQPGVAQEMNVVLTALELQFCELIGATGSPIDIFAAIAKQCANLNNSPVLAGSGVMGTIPGWQITVNNLASAINNMWLTICDIRSAILNIQNTCCPNDCDDVMVTMVAVLTDPNTLKLYFSGTVPVGYNECSGVTLFTISDQSGGSITISVPVIPNLNNALGHTVDLLSTPINSAENLTITASAFCVTDGESQCQTILSYILTNTVNCPTVQVTPGQNNVGYAFSWAGSAAQFLVELYESTQTILIASQTTSVGGPANINGNFTGLSSSTQYYVRVSVTIGENTTVCPFIPATTIAAPCLPPTGLTAEIELT